MFYSAPRSQLISRQNCALFCSQISADIKTELCLSLASAPRFQLISRQNCVLFCSQILADIKTELCLSLLPDLSWNQGRALFILLPDLSWNQDRIVFHSAPRPQLKSRQNCDLFCSQISAEIKVESCLSLLPDLSWNHGRIVFYSAPRS